MAKLDDVNKLSPEFNVAEDLFLNISVPITKVKVFRALNTITTPNEAIIINDGEAQMKAGSRITLSPGFYAQSGSDFHAEIDPNIGSQEGNAISYTYNQAGNRIAKSTSDNVTLHYIRGVEGQTIAVLDENDTPLFYNLAGVGKLVPDGNGGNVSYYYLTDHLGSIRVIIEDNGMVKSHTDYYPFGMQIPGRVMSSLSNDFYKYNAKQLDDEYGLNWLDYGWRPYDGEVGRWWSVDPLSENYPGVSPYNYVLNNPMNLVDPSGLSVKATKNDSGITIFEVIDDNDPTLYIYDEQDGDIAEEINLNEDMLLKDKVYKALAGQYEPEFLHKALFRDITPIRDFALGAAWFVVGGTAAGALTSYFSAAGLTSSEANLVVQWLRTSAQGTSASINTQLLQVLSKLEALSPGITASLYRFGYQSVTSTPAPKIRLVQEYLTRKYQEFKRWIDDRNVNHGRTH